MLHPLGSRFALPLLVLAARLAEASAGGCGRPLPPNVVAGTLTTGLKVSFHDPLVQQPFRHYSLYVPSTYSVWKPLPLILDFHGFDDIARSEAQEDGLQLAAEQEGFMVAYPRGLDDVVDDDYYIYRYYYYFNSWNGGGSNGTEGDYGSVCGRDHSYYPCYKSCKAAGLCRKRSPFNPGFCGSSTCADDVGFVDKLLDHLSEELCVDESRVSATAMSNGAIFLYYLATTSVGKRLSSIVPVEGSLMLGHVSAPAVPIPVLDIHGIYDDTVPANVSNSWGPYRTRGCPVDAAGRQGCTVSNDHWYYTPLHLLLHGWIQANQCTQGVPKRFYTTENFEGHTGFQCMTPDLSCQYPVVRCVHNVEYNGGHTWPFHEGQPRWRRTTRFGELVWWFTSTHGRAARSNMSAHDVMVQSNMSAPDVEAQSNISAPDIVV